MIQLLFSALAAEVAIAISLLFKTPLRRLAILSIDTIKRGRGPIVVKTVSGTVLIIMASSGYSMAKIRTHAGGAGSLSPTDQVLMSRHLLEASLMGFFLVLALIVDRLHHFIRELRSLRKNMEVITKQNRMLEEAKNGGSDDIKARDREIAYLTAQVKLLEDESASRSKEAKVAEADATALKKQSDGFLLEYGRLLEENQELRNQLQSIDHRSSQSDSKKNA